MKYETKQRIEDITAWVFGFSFTSCLLSLLLFMVVGAWEIGSEWFRFLVLKIFITTAAIAIASFVASAIVQMTETND